MIMGKPTYLGDKLCRRKTADGTQLIKDVRREKMSKCHYSDCDYLHCVEELEDKGITVSKTEKKRTEKNTVFYLTYETR
uniref:Uncharacterized protein n=1 Tax=Magallana gigas TaxID=29159 RepID=K1QJ86_MAGGI